MVFLLDGRDFIILRTMKRKNQYGRWERRRAVTPMFLSGYV